MIKFSLAILFVTLASIHTARADEAEIFWYNASVGVSYDTSANGRAANSAASGFFGSKPIELKVTSDEVKARPSQSQQTIDCESKVSKGQAESNVFGYRTEILVTRKDESCKATRFIEGSPSVYERQPSVSYQVEAVIRDQSDMKVAASASYQFSSKEAVNAIPEIKIQGPGKTEADGTIATPSLRFNLRTSKF